MPRLLMLLVIGEITVNSVLAFGSNVATQTITFSIQAISELAVSGDPAILTVSVATAGSGPTSAVDNSTYYALTTNGSSEKLMASINLAMPTATALFLTASPPTGAISIGPVSLDVSDQSIVTGISQVAQSNLQLSYLFQASVGAGVLAPTTRIVTLTLSP